MSENIVVPKNLLYQNKLESAYARSFTSHIPPQSGYQYSAGETITINIPTAPNQIMAGSESMLKFDLTVQNGGTISNYIRLDKCGAHGPIQRLRLYHGSNLLEDLDNYSNLVSQLNVLQKSSACNGKDSILQGFCNDKFCDVQDPANTATKSNQVLPIVAGERLIDDGNNATEFTPIVANGNTLPRTYCINLLSIVGSLSEKYIPLFAMAGTPLRLEIQLASSPARFCCADEAMSNFTLTKVEFIAQMMELGDNAMEKISMSVGNSPLQWVVPQWKNYISNLTVNTASHGVSLSIPAKFNSLKTLISTLRSKADGFNTFFPHGSCRFSLSEYTLRLGSKTIPSIAPSSAPEFFVELLKSMGSVSDINHECMIDLDNYDIELPIANTETAVCIKSTSSSESFMFGIDLETYSNADKSSIFAGYNTSSMDVFLNLQFSGLAVQTLVRCDTYSLSDAVLVCENGLCSARF